jgi:hypothetical protein
MQETICSPSKCHNYLCSGLWRGLECELPFALWEYWAQQMQDSAARHLIGEINHLVFVLFIQILSSKALNNIFT